MGKNVFVSYKYKDILVGDLNKKVLKIIGGEIRFVTRKTRVRDYVDLLQNKIGKEHTNLGEKDGESLKDFSEGYIESSLKNKIYRSSITIVLISRGMKDPLLEEKDQWIPWEISYSLMVVRRANSTSQMNAILGVVLPDENNSYDWYYQENLKCNCVSHKRDQLFNILKLNMFNRKKPDISNCEGMEVFPDNCCFIETVKWDLFYKDHNKYINKAIEIRDDHQKNESYDVKIKIE